MPGSGPASELGNNEAGAVWGGTGGDCALPNAVENWACIMEDQFATLAAQPLLPQLP